MQQSIKGLARQFQNFARDVEELKKGKSIAIMEQRVGDNLGDMPGQNSHPFHEDVYQERPQEEFPRHEAWHKENLYKDYGDNPNVGQAYQGGYYSNQQGDKALDKINVVPKPQASTYKSYPNKEDTPKVTFKDHSKPKVEEKGRLITNPTRCFKCNGVGHIAKIVLPKDLLFLVKT
ncbi:hypothetical protein M9H77_35741 [Catharanthus roseus]|uniref:Uncharacterized protein n=1 Tax=Catharanthus roseus TaxID=4058 RepID=A0ACB9ZSF4_CATRO|nr:hypothetical protein M9H77_35741 [Catharanthus roseus]